MAEALTYFYLQMSLGFLFLSWQVDARCGLSGILTSRRTWVRDAADSANTKSAFLRGCFVYPEACVGERSCIVKKCQNPTSEKC